MEIGQIIKELLREKGIKQSFIAEKIGLKQNSISRKLNGYSPISAEELIIILMTLEVDLNDFVKKMNQKKELNK